MKRFQGFDFYDLDGSLSEEEKLVRKTVRDFVEDQLLPVITRHYRNATFPVEFIPRLAEMGLLGCNLTGYDCAGMNSAAYGLVMQELERGDSGVRSFCSVQSSLVMYPIHAFGSEEQKKRWLPAMARGKDIGCFGLTEPDYGSNPAGLVTRAVQKADRYVLNGTKRWITNTSIATVALVWARAEDRHIRGFLVERGTPGLVMRELEGKQSLRASSTGELILEDCAVPAANVLPGAEGVRAPLSCLNQARYGIAWGAIGSAMACFETCLEYAKTRVQFGKPIGGFQLVQEKLVFMLSEITKAQLLCHQLARLKDEGKATPQQISLAKRNNVDIALETARLARDILGANGILDEYPVFRHMCNLESVNTYEGTHDIHTLILGEALTGLSAFT